MDDLTVCISTFERPEYCQRCIESSEQFLPGTRIVVADDSREPDEWAALGADEQIHLDYDSGLSAKRNRLMEAAGTEFVLFLDDDTHITAHSDTHTPMAALRAGKYDMVGGALAGRKPYCCLIDVRDGVKCETNGHRGEEYPGIWWCDLVENCLFARTEAVREMGGWDEDLKLGEHGEMFLRVWKHASMKFRPPYGRLKVGFCPTFKVGHDHALPTSPLYQEMRRRHSGINSPYAKMVLAKHGLRRLVIPGGQVIEP